MTPPRRPIPPNPPRWTPNPDPASIHISGLDTTAPPHEQIEQLEQLITIKLQNIDENFSKIHHILATRILPAVKRHAVGTESVREAAKFWTSFYEQAAQIRIPTFEDYETVNENTDDPESTLQPDPVSGSEAEAPEPSIISTESSFMPGQHAYSSTPATERTTHAYNNTDDQSGAGSSWATSIESPLVRLDREIQNLEREVQLDTPKTDTEKSSILMEEPEQPTLDNQTRPQGTKGRGREDPPLLRNVLRQNLYSLDAAPGDAVQAVSPLKFRGKTKTPISKTHNPYLPASVEPEKWNGVVDLSNTTPRGLKGKAKDRVADQDESFDGLPAGMSPPVLMSPARPPRSSAELGLLKLGKTPGKEASARISNDLVREIQQKSAQARRMFGYPLGHAESTSMTSSTIPTPPSLSRYTRHEMDDEDSILADSDSDSLDEINNTAHPSAAFLMASQRQAGPDDSFGSSNHSDDSLIAEEAANLGIAPVHPFARGMGGAEFEVDDSFDDDSLLIGGDEVQEETLFGVPPAARLRAGQLRAAGQGQLHLPGQELLEDTIGIGTQFARTGHVEETPTPALPWDRRQV